MQTTSQVTRIRSFQRRISQTFTSTVCRYEVFQYVQTFFEVRNNWVFNGITTRTTCVLLRLSHQTTHTTQLTNLLLRTTGSRIQHHINWVETLVFVLQIIDQYTSQLVVYTCPQINYLVVTLIVCNESHIGIRLDLQHFFHRFANQLFFLNRDFYIAQVKAQSAFKCVVES